MTGHLKEKKILNYLKKEQVHIACLQETHFTVSQHAKLKQDWVGQVFCSSFTSKSRGVAILIHKHLPLSNVNVQADTSGGYVLLKGVFSGVPFTLMNVYIPPIQSNDFITQIV